MMVSYAFIPGQAAGLLVLVVDIKKFFASIDHEILYDILARHIPDQDIMWLLEEIILSFRTPIRNPDDWILNPAYAKALAGRQVQDDRPRGLPLGNLTSQLFVNVYMNDFDQFMKHKLKVKYYIRYADDFVLLSPSREYLTAILSRIAVFLQDQLKLTCIPTKLYLKLLHQASIFSAGLIFRLIKFYELRLNGGYSKRLNLTLKLRPFSLI